MRKSEGGQGGYAPTIPQFEFMHQKYPPCLKLVETFFLSVEFELAAFMKILEKVKTQDIR